MDFDREQASSVEHSILTTKETGLEGQAEEAEATKGRAQNQEARRRASEKGRRNYMQYQSHFKAWCIRKEYTDGDWVTREKFVAYARELTAPQSHTDNDIPRLSVKPLFVKSRDRRSFRRASTSTVEAYMRAVRALYKSQCLVDGIIPNLDEDLGKNEVDSIMKDYDTLLKYTTLDRIRKDGKHEGGEDEGAEDEYDNSDDENIASRESSPSRERSVLQEETSKQQAELPSIAPSAQVRKQSDNEQDNAKDDSSRSKGKRGHRALSPSSQMQDQHFIFAGASQRQHLSHQAHWKEWCIRKRYADGYRVISEKFVTYAKELTAREEYYDKDNPHLCVKPFIVNAHKSDARRASKNTVRAALQTIRALYMDQCTLEKITPNVIVDLAKTAIDSILKDYEDLQDTMDVRRDAEQQDIEPQADVQREAEYQEEVHQEAERQMFVQQEIVQQEIVQQEIAQHEGTQQADAQSSDPDKESSLARLKNSEYEGGSSMSSQLVDIMYTNADTRPYRALFDLLTRSPSPAQAKFRKVPPIMLSTTLSQGSVFSLSRNRILPPAGLQRQLFPFVEDFYDNSSDWKIWVENIMMDRPETANRSPEQERDNIYYKSDHPVIRLLLFVAGLRKVILQDFAAMVAGEGDEDGEKRTGYDHVFAIKHPVLSSPAFREFAGQLREAMAADPARQTNSATETNEAAVEEETAEGLQVQEMLTITTRTRPTANILPSRTEPGRDSSAGEATDNDTASAGEYLTLCQSGVFGAAGEPSQDNGLPTPTSATTTLADEIPTGAVSQIKDTTVDMDIDMDVDEVVDANNNKNIESKDDDAERLLQENQDLRDKVAALERVNRELTEQNQVQQRQSSSRTPEPPVLLTPAASAPRSRVVSMAQDDHTSNSSAGNAYSSPVSAAMSSNGNNSSNINDNVSTNSLQQEIQHLRNQLASLEQKEQTTLDYARVAIESVEFLDNKVNQMEQSMHGLWSIITRNEAAKFAASVSASASASATVSNGVGPRSPSFGLSSPPPVGAAATSPFQQQQYQDPYGRLPARLRVGTLSLKRRAASTASSNTTTTTNVAPSSVHGKTRS
ncbi:hypothetical protein BGW39_003315 [Mortierella sp. 14UC]|nr:hypothetical protein BGW39_003315 [Mortierella sp. 14UC]